MLGLGREFIKTEFMRLQLSSLKHWKNTVAIQKNERYLLEMVQGGEDLGHVETEDASKVIEVSS